MVGLVYEYKTSWAPLIYPEFGLEEFHRATVDINDMMLLVAVSSL